MLPYSQSFNTSLPLVVYLIKRCSLRASIGFWLLDAYYVMQERKYRLLYNNVTDKQENEIDFKMDTRNISGNTKELKYYKCIFSPSVICVYPVIGLAMVAFEIAQKFV